MPAITFIFGYLLAGCGIFMSCSNPSHIDFQAQVRMFEDAADDAGRPTIVNATFSFEEGTTEIMDCVELDGEIIVDVDEVRYRALFPEQQEYLLFHTLGHCALGQKHREHVLSFMNALAPDEGFYKRWREKMIRELFSHPYH